MLIFTFCLALGWITPGHAADEIQLRKYPKSDGQVLDTIPKSRNLKIVEKFGAWRYVLVKGSTYGGGWVHSRDLEGEQSTDQKRETSSQPEAPHRPAMPGPEKRIAAVKNPFPESGGPVKKKEAPVPPAHGSVSLGTVKIHPLALAESPERTEPVRLKKKDPPPRKRPPERPPKEKSAVGEEKSKPRQEPVEPGRQPSRTMKPARDAPLRTEKKDREEQQPEESSASAFTKTAHADTLPESTARSGALLKTPEPPPMPVAVAGGSEDGVAVPVENGNTRDLSRRKTHPVFHSGGIRDILNLGFRLLSVVLSCLAIIFSYKAKRVAAMGYHLVVQLQRNLEISHRSEFNERYE